MTLTRDYPPADVLLDLLDEELGHEQAEVVRAHIDACETCRAVVARVLASGDVQRPDVDLTGSLVADRYRIERKLGAGAMGIVYVAWDRRLERRVALKALAAGTRSRARRLAERLLRESRAMARLRHPNVVAVHDVVHDEGRLFLAMELVEGQTLRQWLHAERSLPQVLDALRQAGQGLAAAHSVGLVHRDFKPDNVLVDRDGRVLVTDFGLARPSVDDARSDSVSDEAPPEPGTSVLTETGAVVGTPAYMAPEQWRGDRVDARCDVYAFCITAFEALVGKRPFAGDTVEELQAAKLARRFATAWSSTVPSRIRRAIEAGLDPDVRRRPHSMPAILARLQPARRAWVLPSVLGVGVLALGGAALVPGDDEAPATSCAIDPLLSTFADQGDLELSAASRPAGWEGVRPRMAAHVVAWRSAWNETCDAVPIDAEDRIAIDVRRSCLDAQGRRLLSVLRLVQSGQADPNEALRSLAPVRACAAERIDALRPVPADPEPRAAVEALRGEIAEAQGEQAAGLLAEVDERAADLVRRARELDYPPILADALYLHGTTASMRSDPERARVLLVESAEAAAAGGHDSAAVEAWIHLMVVVGVDLGEVERALEYGALARATIERLGDAPVVPEMQVRWHLHQGQLLSMKNDFPGALSTFERGLALAQEHDPGSIDVLREAIALTYLSTGRVEDAVALHRVILDARRREIGELHPLVALSHLNLSAALHAAGRYAEALAEADASLRLHERLHDPYADTALRARLNRIDLLRELGRLDEALADADALRAILGEQGRDSAVLVAQLESNASLVLTDLERHTEAAAAARRGLEVAQDRMPDAEVTNFLRICLADSLALVGEIDEALRVAREAVAIARAATGADPLFTAMTEQTLGNVLLEAGRAEEAVAQLERTVRALEAIEADRGVGDAARARLAQALWEAGEHARSRELARSVYPSLDERARRELATWASKRGIAL